MHVRLTELVARGGREHDLEQVIGPGGERARALARVEGYLGCELLRAHGGDGRYLLADYWASQAAAETAREETLRSLATRLEEVAAESAPFGAWDSLGGSRRT